MNKVHFSPSIFLLIVLFSCTETLEIDGFSSEQWKSDRDGCKGQRFKSVEYLMESKEKIIGKKEHVILSFMGSPDENELYQRQQKFYKYYIEPGPKCSTVQTKSDSARYLSVRFNAIGLVKEVFVYN